MKQLLDTMVNVANVHITSSILGLFQLGGGMGAIVVEPPKDAA